MCREMETTNCWDQYISIPHEVGPELSSCLSAEPHGLLHDSGLNIR